MWEKSLRYGLYLINGFPSRDAIVELALDTRVIPTPGFTQLLSYNSKSLVDGICSTVVDVGSMEGFSGGQEIWM